MILGCFVCFLVWAFLFQAPFPIILSETWHATLQTGKQFSQTTLNRKLPNVNNDKNWGEELLATILFLQAIWRFLWHIMSDSYGCSLPRCNMVCCKIWTEENQKHFLWHIQEKWMSSTLFFVSISHSHGFWKCGQCHRCFSHFCDLGFVRQNTLLHDQIARSLGQNAPGTFELMNHHLLHIECFYWSMPFKQNYFIV